MNQRSSIRRAPVEAKLLVCPDCRVEELVYESGILRCARGHEFPIVSDIVDLRLDRDQDTSLDLETYDEHHLVDPAGSMKLADCYNEAIRQFQVAATGKVLEIGSGTGNLTYSLAQSSQFTEIHCSDISLRFLERLHLRLVGHKNIYTYLFDANFLPFQDETFATVVGNSVLHHLMTFENTLRHAHRVLTPGGIAVFGEPVLEFHALVSWVAALMLRIDANNAESVLSLKAKQAFRAAEIKGKTKLQNLVERGPELHKVEDKFIFPIDYMRQLARQLGFSDFHLLQHSKVENLYIAIKRRLAAMVISMGEDPAMLNNFDPILKSVDDAYGAALRPYLSQAFAFFVFVK